MVLATGGAGKVYLYTTNPDVATGDGVAMAYRAGAEIANMEFYQFHPTCLYHPQAQRFLITEAMRGEGAVLRRLDGTPFMKSHDARGDLAPRDVVARAIDFEMKKTGADHVWLDITDKKPAFVKERFPNIFEECLRWGVDITQQPIPVVPAAHFMCGGITTNLEGRTTIPGLWAIGECASHRPSRREPTRVELAARGARLRAPRRAGARAHARPQRALARRARMGGRRAPCRAKRRSSSRTTGTSCAASCGTTSASSGPTRACGARRAASRSCNEEIIEYYWQYFVTRDLLELRNIATVAQLVVECASSRRESRGLHFTIDYREVDEKFARDTVIKRGVPAHLRGR